MSGFVLTKRNRHGAKVYVTRPGSRNSYSPRLANAHIFKQRCEAEADKCENETVEEL